MATEIKTGWIKDDLGNSFAPKSLSSQILYDNSASKLQSVTCQRAIDELKVILDCINTTYVENGVLFLPSITTRVEGTSLILGGLYI